MASQIKQLEKVIKHKQTLTLGKRFLLVALVWCIQLFYIPTSSRLFGGIEPKLPIDVFPVWTVWIVPYLLCYPLWIWCTLWAIFKMEDHLFRSMGAAFLLTCTISISIYTFFPTYVRADTFYGNDIFTAVLRFIHEHAGRYNAFPSGHIYITFLLALFYSRLHPRSKVWWGLIKIIGSLSTLFTHQHYIVDILGGLVVALLGHHFGLRWAGFPPLYQRSLKKRVLQPPP